MNGLGKTKPAGRRILLLSLLLTLVIVALVFLKPEAAFVIFGPITILLVAGLVVFFTLFRDAFGLREDPNEFDDWKSEPYMDPANGSSQLQPRERYKPKKGGRKPSAIRTHRRSLTERTRISDRTKLLDR